MSTRHVLISNDDGIDAPGIEALKEAGVDMAWNEYAEVGSGLATEVIGQLGKDVNP